MQFEERRVCRTFEVFVRPFGACMHWWVWEVRSEASTKVDGIFVGSGGIL